MKTTFPALTIAMLMFGLWASAKDLEGVAPIRDGIKISADELHKVPKNIFFSVYLLPGQNYTYFQTGPEPPSGMFFRDESVNIVTGDYLIIHPDYIEVRCHHYMDDVRSDGFRQCAINKKDIDYIIYQKK